MSITAYLRSADYNIITPKQLRTVSTSRSENEMLFTPSVDQTDAAVVFMVRCAKHLLS